MIVNKINAKLFGDIEYFYYLCIMKSDKKTIQAISGLATGEMADVRTLQAKLRQRDKEISSIDKKNALLVEENSRLNNLLAEKMDEIARNMKFMTDFIMGKGEATLSGHLRDEVISAMKAEFERQLTERDATIDRLNRKIAELESRDRDGDGKTTEVKIKEQQNRINSLENTAYGQSTEGKYNRGGKSANPDDLDMSCLDEPEVSEEDWKKMAQGISEKMREAENTDGSSATAVKEDHRHNQKGKPKPRRIHNVEVNPDRRVDIYPDYWPDDAIEMKTRVIKVVVYVPGHFEVHEKCLHRFRDSKNNFYEAKAGDRLFGRVTADKSLIAFVLERHFVQHVTLSMIEEELRVNGLNFSHSTVSGWIRKAGEVLGVMDEAVHDEILSSGNIHADETTLSVRDVAIKDDCKARENELRRIAEKQAGAPLPGEADEHYFKRWLYCFMSEEKGLVQYFFYGQGRRTREAMLAYMGKDFAQRTYIHTDGAPMYKCYDHVDRDDGKNHMDYKELEEFTEYVFRVACAVHMRRPFYKLKNVSYDAAVTVDLFDLLFRKARKINDTETDPEEIRKRRVIEIGPILDEIYDKLKDMASYLRKETEPDLFRAVEYALGEFPCLMRCLEDGSLQFSNNICEQQMRRIAIYRNNSLFVGSIESAKTFARINSYVQSCRLCGVNTFKWICSLPDNLVKLSKESLRAWLPNAMKSDSNLCVSPALI